jgi:hypothetical protein
MKCERLHGGGLDVLPQACAAPGCLEARNHETVGSVREGIARSPGIGAMKEHEAGGGLLGALRGEGEGIVDDPQRQLMMAGTWGVGCGGWDLKDEGRRMKDEKGSGQGVRPEVEVTEID